MPPDRVNRRDQIIDVASRLFMEQGFTATSVRQIADEVGCTEAALYYHFKEGKRELLQAALACNLPDLSAEVAACEETGSLYEFIKQLTRRLILKARDRLEDKVRWLMAEYPEFSEDERELLRQRLLTFHATLYDAIKRFVTDEAEADSIGWSLAFMLFGYGQMMVTMNIQSYAAFDLDRFVEFTARRLSNGH